MANPFFKINSNRSIGAGARVMIVNPIGTYPIPSQLSHFFDLTTYAANTTYGWQDIGSTKTPSRFQIGFAKTDWNNEQVGLYRSVVGNWSGQATCEALEIRAAMKRLLMHATNPGAPGPSGEVRTNFNALTDVPFVRLAYAMKDHLGLLHVSCLPKAQWDGGQIADVLARTDSRSIPMSWALFADDTNVDAVTGDAILRFDIDQEPTGV